MARSDEALKEGERTFRRRRLALRLLYLAAALIIVTGLFARSMGEAMRVVLLVGAGLLILSFIVISWLHWRCPACGRRFQMRHSFQEGGMAHCPYCGVLLRRT